MKYSGGRFSSLVIAVILAVGITGYVVPFLMSNKTKISEGEVVIERPWGFMSSLKYALDRRTGDEALSFYSMSPFADYALYLIEYKASCQCIGRIYYGGVWVDDNFLSFTRQEDGTFDLSDGGFFRRNTVLNISSDQVQEQLPKAQAALEEARKRFADLIPKS